MSSRTAAPLGLSRRAARRAFDVPQVDFSTLIAAVAFLGMLVVALFGDRIAPHESIYFVVEHGTDPRPYDPGLVFPFGSDVLGRDLFSLVLAGARATLTIVLLAGLARVVAGVAIAAVGNWWRPARIATEAVADFASAVPATLVALLLVKVFVRTSDTSVSVFIGALLLTGWAGPYRIIRAEIDRLVHAPFTEGAAVIGVRRWRMFWRHQFPHLVPILATNLSQQVVASLVLLAELGVLGVFVGSTRQITIEESLSRVENGIVSFAQIADPPEWGGLLASARTIESLWTTRWLIFVPGVAFALTGIAVGVIGLAVSRRYARRDVTDDLRSGGAAAIGVTVLALFVVSALLPQPYAAATAWAADARGALQPSADPAAAFAAAGLTPLAGSYAISREGVRVAQSGGAYLKVGSFSISETWPRNQTKPTFGGDIRSFVTSGTGGGPVEAPVVFAARGISPSEHPPPPANTTLYGGKLPELGESIKDYPDDYAGIDVRGKVVLLVRFLGVVPELAGPNTKVFPPAIGVEESIAGAIRRGAAAVVFVDPDLPDYSDQVTQYLPGLNPYLRAERDAPPTDTVGIPVVVLSAKAGAGLASAVGVDLSLLLGQDPPDRFPNQPSLARDTGVTARIAVPLERRVGSATSFVGEVADVPHDAGYVLVWCIRHADDPHPSADVLAALAKMLAPRRVPFIFVDFDDSVDPTANTATIRAALAGQRIALVVVLRDLTGDALKLTTPYGDLIPAFDLYAAQAGARSVVTRSTAALTALDGIAPFADVRSVLVESAGGTGDLRPDAAALVGYLAGRLALGAEELPK